jgi:predicted phage-related endonuclease
MYQLAAEILTGQIQDSFSSEYMEWGTETEPAAREIYELENNERVEQVGFICLDNSIGVSPDGLVGPDGLLEIKCPKTSTQLSYFIDQKLPGVYRAQVQGQLMVTGRQWCDFVSYDPRINAKAGYMQIRVERDEEYIGELLTGINTFIGELGELLKKLRGEA